MSFWGIARRIAAEIVQYRRCPSCQYASSTPVYSCYACRRLYCNKCSGGLINTYCPECGAACDKQRDHYGQV